MARGERSWETTFACPRCGKRCRVRVVVMGSALRCPHCRSLNGIGVQGMHPVSLAELSAAERQSSSRGSSPPAPVHNARQRPLGKFPFGAGRWAAVAGLAALALALLLWPNVQRQAEGTRGALEHQAGAFYGAWLAGDRNAAQSLVDGEHRPQFQLWWEASRKGFAEATDEPISGSSPRVLATDEGAGEASTVRFCFQVAGQERAITQRWVRRPEGWRVLLIAANAND